MKTFYRIFRSILVSLLTLAVALPFILYVVVSLPVVQRALSDRASEELSSLLGTKVEIGEVDIALFNRVVLRNVGIDDNEGREALSVGHLGAGINLFESLWKQRLIISYVELVDMKLSLYKATPEGELNILPIIERFKKREGSEKKSFDLAVNLLVVRRSSLSYDLLYREKAPQGIFDPAHIHISDIKADISAPVISDRMIEGQIKRLMAKESCGLQLTDLTADVMIDTRRMSVDNFQLATDNSLIAFEKIETRSPLSKSFSIEDCLIAPLTTREDTHINITDIAPFFPEVKSEDLRIDVDFSIAGSLDSLAVDHLNLAAVGSDTHLLFKGEMLNIRGGVGRMSVTDGAIDLFVNTSAFLDYLNQPSSSLYSLYGKIERFRPLGEISLKGDFSFNPQSADFVGVLTSEKGALDINANLFRREKGSPVELLATLSTESFDPSEFYPALNPLTEISFKADADLSLLGKQGADGGIKIDIERAIWKEYNFENIAAEASFEGKRIESLLTASSPLLDFEMKGVLDLSDALPSTSLYADIASISLAPFVKDGEYKNFTISLGAEAATNGVKPDDISGSLRVENLVFTNGKGRTLKVNEFTLDSEITDSLRTLSLRSPFADANISGDFRYTTLAPYLKSIVAKMMPSLLPDVKEVDIPDDFMVEGDIEIKEDTILPRFFNLPVEIIYPVSLTSFAQGGEDSQIGLDVDMPYLRNKDKLIEDSRISLRINGSSGTGNLYAHTSYPTKNGMLGLNVKSSGAADSLKTDVSWSIDRLKEFKGNLSFLSDFVRNSASDPLQTTIKINKSNLVFNDSAWTAMPGEILVSPGRITINNLSGGRHGQWLSINGVASADSTDRVVVKLDHIDLDYIFETLDISDAVQFGGRATGDFYGQGLLSKSPILYTPKLKVTDLKYNRCVMGDGTITSYWNNKDNSINIHAVIDQKNGENSLIDGFIRPSTEQLDFNFEANQAPIGFMAPFMSAFTSSIDGEVSGNAHLFGTFKDLDMTGDIYVKDLKMKLDFTNVTYTATDSIHISPGLIRFADVKLTDPYGQTAMLGGYVTHNFFHDPTFSFNVTDAKDLLVYDVRETDTEDPWFGRIFGNGKATVTGIPGHVDINVVMTTAPKSTFTFVLSDAEQALDYTFITLRDRDRFKKDSIAAQDAVPMIVKQLRERVKNNDQSDESVYSMSFEIDITPLATMNLVMDPVGGDKITSHGSGHIRMDYSSDGDLRMYGDYTINRGSYNFTLQDIIIKDFTIREGGKISFLGDPYAAQLDITASYSVNANLSDLDESFLADRELNRTKVPVDALLMVKGDMRQPDITFDLDFPTLNSDTYRKVRSIVSTEDMMNRQIIYLLALNKFYTPDYMNATHGNELVSVASSTISSRISSMLGQLSNNWSIAPSFRSDRGDFSDVEVDVALSSNLLNNRLLFNGNFGYRDKSLNNNSFIGDFDIRYLLNRAGTLQLKAYNRYNDQNYYLKSATTTQGVGIVFKRDFDNLLSFLRGFRKKRNENSGRSEEKKDSNNSAADTIPAAVTIKTEDSIPQRNSIPVTY